MGHDICGYNKAREEIAYVRFTMWDTMAFSFYDFLDATDYYAGVSGRGDIAEFTVAQMEKALTECKHFYKEVVKIPEDSEFLTWQRDEIYKFIHNCLGTAHKEGSVKIGFG